MQIVQRLAIDLVLAVAAFAWVIGISAGLELLDNRLSKQSAINAGKSKVVPLEGLRGILALSVAAHHAYCWYSFTQSGLWSTHGSIIFERFAGFGVQQFFFISGFLFWRKLMAQGRIDLGRFYLSRFVRLAPVYYVCLTAAILIGFSLTHFKLVVAPGELAVSLTSWLLFSLGGAQLTVNGADISRIFSGVVWTLVLEWIFYLSLPFLGWFSRKSRRLLALALLNLLLFTVCKYLIADNGNFEEASRLALEIRTFAKFMLMGFGGGILVAAFYRELAFLGRLSPSRRNVLLAVLYGVYLLMPDFPGFDQVRWLCIVAGFALVVFATDLFGFLTSRPVRFLGVISYDLYLLHGLVYFTAMRLRGGIHPVAPLPYMAQTAVALAVITVLAALMHRYVERPTMAASERIARPRAAPPVELLQPTGVPNP